MLFVVLLFGTLAQGSYNVQELADEILRSKVYPSVTDTDTATVLAKLLIKEMANYETETEVVAPLAFPCTLTPRSDPRPTDAQQLRPADIDVVATIGDSVAAGFGALATTIFSVFTEYRGYSFPIGGQVTYDEFSTVPNILKLYNPNIKGFAVGNGGQTSANAVLNAAVSGARSYDLVPQITYLEERMKGLSGVDFNNDWKMISIFIGGNDLCDYCSDTTKNSPANFQSNLEAALDAIKARFPKVFVNLMSPPDVTLLGQVASGLCSLLHAYECGCAGDIGTKIAHGEYVQKLVELVTYPKYQDKIDFHVSLQPFLSNFTLPLVNGVPDRSYFAPDCFHFSGKAHQAAAVALWNNMCEPSTSKKISWVPGEPIECPQEFIM